MASKKKDMHYPVVRTGRMNYTGPAVSPQIEMNADQFLSKVNRRLYRQSRNYSLKLDVDPNATQIYNVFVLNDSWMTERALKMAYDAYREATQEERDRLKDNAIARWSDFRVDSGQGYQQLNPIQFSNTLAPTQLAAGDFQLAAVSDSTGQSRTWTWGNGTASKYGIFQEYDKAGNAQKSPNTSTGDMPYDELMADDSAFTAAALQQRGDEPPYDADGVNDDRKWIKVATLNATANGQKLSTGFFTAPCGIVLISAGLSGDEVVDASFVEWTAKSGDYKGVHAPSLLE